MAGALVGNDFLSASVQVLCDKLASTEISDLFCKKKLDGSHNRLREKLLTLCAVLNDAEGKQITNHAVREWLQKLRDVVFDVEDLLVEISTEVLPPTYKLTEVLNFLSTSFTPFQNVVGMNDRIKELLKRLEHLAKQKDGLGLREGVGGKVSQTAPTTSLLVGELFNEEPDHWDERRASHFMIGGDYVSELSDISEGYDLRRGKKATPTEWTFLLFSLGLEILSIAFDQASSPNKPQFALCGMLLAIVGVLASILELTCKGIKGRVKLGRWGKLWWFYYPPPHHYMPFGTLLEIYGLLSGITQSVCSTIQYVYFIRHSENPIKVSLLPAILVICLITSRLSNDRMYPEYEELKHTA